jgi:hypothetical protein
MRLVSVNKAGSPARHRHRGPVGAVIASAILILATVGSTAAASPSKSSPWTPVAPRTRTVSHLPSARAAAKAALGSPRNTPTTKKPLLKAKLGHPAAASASALPKRLGSSAPRPQIVSGPDVTVTQNIAGLALNDGPGLEPPDPWVAANATHVVQAINSTVRITSRSGAELLSLPSWALFGLVDGQFSSDVRIIWDPVHGRWVGVTISFDSAFSANYLTFAVSDTADPTLGWATYSALYGSYLPDYPSIASSTDKIVITDDVYDSTDAFAFVAQDLVTFTWASILGGGNLSVNECIADVFIHARAAQVLSPSADVHVVLESTADMSQQYFRITGAGDCFNDQYTDPTSFVGFAAFTPPPDARQVGGDTLVNAMDERPTDAIWQNGQLWWVSTFPWTYDIGATYNDAVVLWHASTVASGPASEVGTELISAGDGIDDFMAGIGFTRNGTLVTTYSESSATDYISLMTNQIAPGLSLGTPVPVDTGDAAYVGERWGDFAGVAMDPIGTGAVWATHEVAASDGTWRTDVVRLVADDTAPTTPGLPAQALVTPTTLGASVPVRLTWTAATDLVSGTVRYRIKQNVDGGAFEESNSTGTTTVRSLLIGHTYQFAVAAIDAVGNIGSFGATRTLRPYLTQSSSSTTVTGTWHTSTSSSFSGGSARYATAAGAAATFTATTARSIAIVATKARTRGSFKVYVDGVYKGTISTYSTTTKYRQLVYQFSWSTAGTHKVKIVVSGTSGHPRVDLDAFVVLR